ncbi:aldehyde dehydrogenase (plasmid) [Acidiphilium multivorum AIU301]|uniref:Aldehyde dehydrogenase n=1 Tax=Acidiphilium multivorum (strain DSM 11245 / JCM 8867 / NBRC 100883 / AIU 301) TaxID=926570 RepID=F0J7H5_ACIMA|nr:aldehyde dehydrogenase [Acidiphilium multivorum]BAJ83042.1 aldehyde dehydrogenase [Acidiphilium multivorum AIU301]GAN74749.1 aldehyde dehydrogenase [Acidiphilium multivorum AIU301]
MMRRFRQYIDGEFVDAARSFESIDPATGDAWSLMPEADAADVDRAVTAAHRALHDLSWSGLTPTARGRLLYRLGDLLEEQAQALAELETRDTGKVIRETSAQVAYIAEYYRYFGGLADKIEGAHLAVDKPDMEVYLRREPIGVVAAVVPWNSQLFLAAVKIGPALAAGCTVVVKASEDGPAPLLEFAQLVDQAGFPPGVVNIITGFGDPCGQRLTSHPLVSRIAFTGGPETARHVVRNSAENLSHVTLELGGKSPVLVFDDADLDNACNAIIAGIFAASGQSCVAGSRLLVQNSIHDTLVSMLSERVGKIKIGDPSDPATEMGPLATARQHRKAVEVIQSSVKAGAVLTAGGKVPPGHERGFYLEPTILQCPNNDIPCSREELFAPVLSVMRFDTEADGIAFANDTCFALAAGIFTNDLRRAHRLIRSVKAGVVWVNTYRAISPVVPFGGFGWSGLGREGGRESVMEYTRPKAVWINSSTCPFPDPFIMR